MASAQKPIARQNQQVLKCPRCNSLNTKFCYYNNYSLSQPRHFCKSCKRYWTRGGTLRNVPVGGGCRKNKRIKRPFTAVDDTPYSNLDHRSTPSNNNHNPVYGLLQRNPKYPRFNTQPQMTSLGSGFSSSDHPGDSLLLHDHDSMSHVSNYPSMFSGGLITSSCNSDHRMSYLDLLASNHQQQPTVVDFAPYADGGGTVVSEVQMGTDTKGQIDTDHQIFKGLESSDPNSFLWTISGGDAEWHDPASNISATSLI